MAALSDEPRQVELNHVLKEEDDRTRCVVCLVAWTDLTERDKIMLTTRGKCIGRVERWRPCKLEGSRLCIGHNGRCD